MRLPRYAETEVQRLCAVSDALYHAVDEDESGWDCFVEFPELAFSGPADLRPPRLVAYVQVKSVATEQLKCRIKLSNALRAARSPQPWFVVLVTGRTDRRPARIFAVHVWHELILRTLEAVRRAHNVGRPLHKCSLTIKFQHTNEVGEQLIHWMRRTIEAESDPYEVAKRAIGDNAGYEDGYGTGQLTIEASSEDEIIRSFLGLGGGLAVKNFSFRARRFGVDSAKPEIEKVSGVVHIEPQSAGDVEIRLRSAAGEQTIVLNGKVYGAGLPIIAAEKRMIRFSAGIVDVIWGQTGPFEFRSRLDEEAEHKLSTLENFVAVNQWLGTGPVDLQVWTQGRRMPGGRVNRNSSATPKNLQALSSALRLLRSIAGHLDPELSLRDLAASIGIGACSDLADAPSFRIEFEWTGGDPVERSSAIIYWFQLEVGSYVYCAIAEWNVVEDILVDPGRRRVTAQQGRLVEAYVLHAPSEIERQMTEHDYDRHLHEVAKTGAPLDLGDLLPHIIASQLSAADSSPT